MLDVVSIQQRLGVTPDGVLGPITLAAIFARLGAPTATAQALASTGVAALKAAGILDTGLRLAHFLAQCGDETLGFTRFTEIWGPTPQQLKYEGNVGLGNVHPGDGYRYRGRGFPDITGRRNYVIYGALINLDLVNNPDLAALPANAIRIGAAFWTNEKLNPWADNDDLLAVSRGVNTRSPTSGVTPNGMPDRTIWLARSKRVLL